MAADELDRTMQESFARVEMAERYRAWIMDEVRPHLGRRILEVGCGVGNITAHLLERERVVAIDAEERYVGELRRRLGDSPKLRALAMCVESSDLPALSAEGLDCAVLLNVLEHVDDDVAALRNVRRALCPGATVVIQVPAHRWLFGSMDRSLGHRRRYEGAQLRRVLSEAGLEVARLWEVNLFGVAGWLWNGRLLRRRMFSERHLRLYEALVPLLRALEPKRGAPLGLSIMAVARVPRAR